MGNPVVHFEIVGKDAESLSEFYSSLFDWEAADQIPGGLYGLDPKAENEVCGHILPTTDDMPVSNYVSIYVQVDDLQASLDKAESLGGKTCVPPQVIPGDNGTFAMFLDPSGNCVGLYKPEA